MARASARGQIVEAAVKLFSARGFNGVSVQDLVDEAGVPKGSFYNHFKSKEALALAALENYGRESGEERLHDERKPPLERLRGQFEWLARKLEKSDFQSGCMLGNLSAEAPRECDQLCSAVGDSLQGWSEQVASLLKKAAERGELPEKKKAERLGRYLINAWEGAVSRARVLRSRKPLDEFIEVTFEELLE